MELIWLIVYVFIWYLFIYCNTIVSQLKYSNTIWDRGRVGYGGTSYDSFDFFQVLLGNMRVNLSSSMVILVGLRQVHPMRYYYYNYYYYYNSIENTQAMAWHEYFFHIRRSPGNMLPPWEFSRTDEQQNDDVLIWQSSVNFADMCRNEMRLTRR